MRTHLPRLKLWLRLLLLLITAGLTGCIEPTEFELPATQRQLVVDGRLLSDTTLTAVRLSFAQGFDAQGRPAPITDAQVSVHIEGGALFALPYDAVEGDYRSSVIPRVMGGRYQLRVQLADGRSYASSYEALLAPPALGPMRFAFVRRVVTVPTGYYTVTPVVESGFDVTLPIFPLVGEQEFYAVETIGIWEGFTLLGDPPIVPCCSRCWAFDRPVSPRVALADDLTLVGGEIAARIATVPNSYPSRYQVLARALRISPDAHRYLTEVRTLQDLSGSLFDPLPAQPRGNIRATTASLEPALGIFLVAGARHTQLLINRRPFSQPGLSIDRVTPNADCRTIYPNSVTVRPPSFPAD